MKCPDGYFCGYGTSPETQFVNKCPAGYFCPEGTAASGRFQFPCSACHYCPEGTGVILPRCPEGTESDPNAENIDQCFADRITFWRIQPLKRVLIDEAYAMLLLAYNESTSDRRRSLLELGEAEEDLEPLLSSFDVAGVAEYIKSGKCGNIIFMAGAGISVSAGIPDFRTPGTGLYDNLQKYDLPHPTAVFELDYFQENPAPFYLLAKELYPGQYPPTPTHHFVRLLHEKGLLLRCFTQNIDSLEAAAGLPHERIVAAHGNFDSARCLKGHPADVHRVREHVDRGEVMRCESCDGCDALVKPDIVFFGENLPERFARLVAEDFPKCDLLIVAGTSLAVHPFAGLINHPGEDVPRMLVNREKVGEMDESTRAIAKLIGRGTGFDFGETNRRDALHLGDCDAGFEELARLLGWEDELKALVEKGRAQTPVKERLS